MSELVRDYLRENGSEERKTVEHLIFIENYSRERGKLWTFGPRRAHEELIHCPVSRERWGYLCHVNPNCISLRRIQCI